MKKIRSLNLKIKILFLGIRFSFGFLGTFLLNNFLRETYRAKQSELEKNIENFLNKEVDLGDYSGIRVLGFSLGSSKMIDKENINSQIKAKNVYVGIMPIKSFLNQKWIVKISPNQAEFNLEGDFFKSEKGNLKIQEINKSKFNDLFNSTYLSSITIFIKS